MSKITTITITTTATKVAITTNSPPPINLQTP
jgi:hypothetical protein